MPPRPSYRRLPPRRRPRRFPWATVLLTALGAAAAAEWVRLAREQPAQTARTARRLAPRATEA